ncbi:GL18371 [Drosophila persimilis]|uniref:GL18371 n=1 Tax=Drosophila persimilis TaxID=7234 RepID=B4H9R3_DROPE|nr:GL18371 [Drosophila persimilis]
MSSSQECVQLTGPIMKVMQLNPCAASQDLLSQTVRELAIDLAILSESYQNRESPAFILDAKCEMAVSHLCSFPSQALLLDLCAKVAGVWEYSVYLTPSLSLSELAGTLNNLAADARGRHPVAIGHLHTSTRGLRSGEAWRRMREEGLCWTSRSSTRATNIPSPEQESDQSSTLRQQTASVETAASRWKCYRKDKLNTALFTELMTNLTTTMAQRRHYGRHHQPVFWWNESIAASTTPLPALARKHCLSARAIYVQGLQKGSQSRHKEQQTTVLPEVMRLCGAGPMGKNVQVDSRLCFREHLAYMGTKAATSNGALEANAEHPMTKAMTTTTANECDEIGDDICGANLLIPVIDAWVNRKHGQVNFYLTQLLSGHGCFQSYLHHFGQEDFAVLLILSAAPSAGSSALTKQNLGPYMFLSPDN